MALELTDCDYDARCVVMKEQMPRIPRELFPRISAQLVETAVLTITVTESEIIESNKAMSHL